MKKLAIAVVLGAAVSGATACRQSAAPEASAPAPAAGDAQSHALLQRLASAVVARDYAAAYACLATERQATVTLAEFEEAFRHYREALPDNLSTTVSVDPYDRDAATLVPEELRERIVAEGAVEFDPGGEELEGFAVNVWIMLEAGEPRLASFYVGD